MRSEMRKRTRWTLQTGYWGRKHKKNLQNNFRKVKLTEIDETLKISKEHVGSIGNELDMKKLCSYSEYLAS